MWYLINSEGVRLYIRRQQIVTFGRKNATILLQNDESISRTHGSITNTPQMIIETQKPTSICLLKDLKSKYGTYRYVNGNPVEIDETGYILKHKDVIRFGLQQHVFNVYYIPIVTATSMLTEEDRIKLQNIMNLIDGTVCGDWGRACTYLTVSKIMLTEKVTCAMAAVMPIVTVDYWEAVKTTIERGVELPSINDFVPPIYEGQINKATVSVLPNENRKTLFKDLIFVHFSTQQYKMYSKIIHMIGGKSTLYGKKRLSLRDMCAPNVVVLQHSNKDTSQVTQPIVPEYDELYNGLQRHNRRMISETEIPLAILHCSTAVYCNPKFKMNSLLMRSNPPPDTSKILAPETMDYSAEIRELPKVISNVPVEKPVALQSQSRTGIVIAETCDSACDNNSSSTVMQALQPAKIESTNNIIPESDDRVSSIIESSCGYQSIESNIPRKRPRLQENSKTQIEQSTKRISDEHVNYIPETNDPSETESNNDRKQVAIGSLKRAATPISSQEQIKINSISSPTRERVESPVYIPDSSSDEGDSSSNRTRRNIVLRRSRKIVSDKSEKKYNLRRHQSTSIHRIIPETNYDENDTSDSEDHDKENLISQSPKKSLKREEDSDDDNTRTSQDSLKTFQKSYLRKRPKILSSDDEDWQVTESCLNVEKIEKDGKSSSTILDKSREEVQKARPNIQNCKEESPSNNNSICIEKPAKELCIAKPVIQTEEEWTSASPETTPLQPVCQIKSIYQHSLIRNKRPGKFFKKVSKKISGYKFSIKEMVVWSSDMRHKVIQLTDMKKDLIVLE